VDNCHQNEGETMSHLSTDILIIGSGGAGLRAALEAVTVGVHVIVEEYCHNTREWETKNPVCTRSTVKMKNIQ
jgi:heterodisulfide reductase subunit A-like polyferredoxin